MAESWFKKEWIRTDDRIPDNHFALEDSTGMLRLFEIVGETAVPRGTLNPLTDTGPVINLCACKVCGLPEDLPHGWHNIEDDHEREL